MMRLWSLSVVVMLSCACAAAQETKALLADLRNDLAERRKRFSDAEEELKRRLVATSDNNRKRELRKELDDLESGHEKTVLQLRKELNEVERNEDRAQEVASCCCMSGVWRALRA